MRPTSGTRPARSVEANAHPTAATNAGGASSSGNSACGPRASQAPASAAAANAAQARGRNRNKGAASAMSTRSSAASAARRLSPDSVAAWASSGYATAARQRSANAARGKAPASGGLVLLDMRGERAQRREDAAIVGTVG